MKRLLLLALLALPAHAQWAQGPEQILTSPATGTAPGNFGPSVAASDTNFLAAWLSRVPQSPRIPGTIDVMPFSKSGAQRPVQLAIGPAFSAPALASNGSEYVVATTVDGAIAMQRLALDGTPLGEAKTITPSRSTGQIPVGGRTRVSWDGAHYVVVATSAAYVNSVIQTSVEAAIVNADGSLASKVSFGPDETFLDAATASGVTLALTVNQKTLLGRYVDGGGNVSAPFAVTADSVAGLAGVASDGTSFLAVWIDEALELRAARIGLAGDAGATQTIAPSVSRVRPAVAWNGRDFVLSWTDSQTELATWSDAQAGVAPLHFTPAADGLALAASNGDAALVASHDEILGRVVAPDRSVQQFPLSLIALGQFSPRLAGDALFYLQGSGAQAFSLLRNGATLRDDVLAYDVAPNDPDAAAVLLSDSEAGIVLPNATWLVPADGNQIALASSGRTRLVVFRKGNAVRFFRVDAAGNLLDGAGVQLSDGQGDAPAGIRAVWRGDAFVVVWEEGNVVKSARVGEDGSHDREVVKFIAAAGSTFYNVATSGGVTALAWRVDSLGTSDLYVGRVDPESPAASVAVARAPLPHSVTIAAVLDGFDLAWIGDDRLGWRSTISRDFQTLSPRESLGAMPAYDVTFVYGETAPRRLLYSKGTVVAVRAIGKARRRVAAAP